MSDVISSVVTWLQGTKQFQRVDLKGNYFDMAQKSGAKFEDWISTDDKNVCEFFIVQQGGETDIKIRFPLSLPLTTEDVTKHAVELLNMAGSLNTTIGLFGDRLTLTYSLAHPTKDGAVAAKACQHAYEQGTKLAKRIRDVVGSNLRLDTNLPNDKLYQFKRGKPVKLDQRDMALAMGGISFSGAASIVGLLIAAIPLAVTQVGGLAIDVAEAAETVLDHVAEYNYAPPTGHNPGWAFGPGGQILDPVPGANPGWSFT